MDEDQCFACGARLARPEFVFTADRMSDGRHYEVYVGPECFKHVIAGGESGYQPPRGGPRLFSHVEHASHAAQLAARGEKGVGS
jgi:hypothetical protein